MTDEQFHSRVGSERISTRQVDELIGLAHGLAADGILNQAEVEFLQKWLAANHSVSCQPLLATLFERVNDILSDGVAETEECRDLLATLTELSNGDFELGEALKSDELSGAKAIVLEGHTDAKGSPAYNKILSLRRAQSVKNFLATKHSIPSGKLKAVGKGSTELADPKNPEDSANRRVRIIVDG